MKRLMLIAIVLALNSFGCQTGTIQASAVDSTFRRVADRHDKYVAGDASLSALDKSIDLRDTSLLRGVLDAAKPATQPTK